ncbi:hypothetical protein K431DRAFT_296033 [Polychaeton citri CBS 116435]|uniref:Amidohydrolase-related domain-containing protein n=1 Tax=Polychaeton citri CBS 116435 TaxID=1314669 RepID=A0A9P4Q785_9PEZI|nr:hypothetical protein K431DRAFT_296033 [Polychaeton citri CBS 116435]
MEKDELPKYSDIEDQLPKRHWRRGRCRHGPPRPIKLIIVAFIIYAIYTHWFSRGAGDRQQLLSISRLEANYAQCAKLQSKPKDPSGFRERNARYIHGGKPILIKNATVWTGEPKKGTTSTYEWINADILLEDGLVKEVSYVIAESSLPEKYAVYNAHGRPLTAGIVDMHSHAGVDSLPELNGNEDTNELSSDITPYVRSIDGLQPLDHQIQVIKSGGVTTSLILPGSGNNIGGEAFVIKHAVGPDDGRSEISAHDMLADPDHTWRYMKMACGENAKSVYGRVGRDFGPFSRLGEAWYFRHAFEQARKFINAQDDWCATAEKVGASNMQEYLPLELEWESLAAALRGQVRVNTHCYTIPDLESFVGHTNEFEFEVRAFHHAHQTYLVPEILKRAYGNHTPAAALFADNMYYKAESYIGSEQAGKILYENGVDPVYVSDNPVINAQHVLFEAAKAYKNGLPYEVALAGVTSKSAELLGLGERVGKVVPGFDADIVVWDSDPLSVGAAPVQVWIDGVAQYKEPFEKVLPSGKAQILGAVDYLGTTLQKSSALGELAITGIKTSFNPAVGGLSTESDIRILMANGRVECVGKNDFCGGQDVSSRHVKREILDLGGNGYVTPPLTAFGSFLGLVEITAEADTQDGSNGGETFSAAIDGLSLDTKNLEVAYDHGVTRAITAPQYRKYGGHKGVSVGFRTGSHHALEEGAVFQDHVAVHYILTPEAKQEKTPSLSSAVEALRTKLHKAATASEKDVNTVEEKALREVVKHGKPLVITVHSADIIASLLRLKKQFETEADSSQKLRLVIYGGAEAHLVAEELAATKTAVVLAPLQPYSESWDQRRSLTGVPLTNGTHLDKLLEADVKVAIGTKEDWETRDLALFAGIAYANSGGKLSEKQALSLVSDNVYEILGIEESDNEKERKQQQGLQEFVIWEGNPLEIQSRVRAVVDGSGRVTIWQ